MEPRSQTLARRFAQQFVGAMLERSGADFQFVPSKGEFLVMVGGRPLAIHVRYVADPQQAGECCAAWLKSKAMRAHLVIVSGTGDVVFADDVIAPLLETDHRTVLTILDTHPSEVPDAVA